MSEPSHGDVIRELHDDLARRYKQHGPSIIKFWRSFDSQQRARCMKAGVADGAVLKHSLDRSLGNVYKFIPEWNLRDITAADSDLLLDILKYRASSTLVQQYAEGVNGGPGDCDLIADMIQNKGLRHVDSFKDCFTFFLNDETYGRSVRIMKEREQTMAGFAPAIRAGLCIPQSHGELVLQRQSTLLQTLVTIVDDILDEGSKTRKQPTNKPPKPDTTLAGELSKLNIQPGPANLSLPDLTATAQDRRAALEERLSLVSSDPVVLAHDTNFRFYSRPELVPDEKGRSMGVHTDKYISAAVFEVIHNVVQESAIWRYIDQLLQLLSSNPDKAYRPILVQELSNMCHLEYARAQQAFKRNVQTASGMKWFKRVSGVYDKPSDARVNIKGNVEDLTRLDPQLHYMLRLCQPETTAAKAVDWIKKLSDLHNSHPEEREKLEERETEALGNLAIIIGFISDLSPTISMPPLSRKQGQMFVSRSQGLEAELDQFKKEVDLRDFAVPIDNLLEPGMTEGALKRLDEFIVAKAGTKLGFLYQDLIQDCLDDLDQKLKAKLAKVEPPAPQPFVIPEQPEERIQQRREKEKTRPSTTTVFDILPPKKGATAAENDKTTEVLPKFKVRSSTAQVFSTLFDKSLARGSVSWTAFTAAMTELGFSLMPKFGSVFTFFPPQTMDTQKPLTMHRPHGPHIEGHLVPIYARQLARAYGWGKETFETA
ncbi:hypothetical protein B0T26DRAFT_660066 [Lasiosphaeria miniovina]|uniref:Ipa protein n=1 Tax=Lasiosphaeria miniovina TaxID=1954250 RepID=A0AA39ZQS0_9PEZI|nr:uncharacterized protein B0T26DRAFT_660066 [Lasiosphaeria miniovina]KAK0701873.1 hypothetical protein B0T26DRAFT_660066 [Lasiosphaeria miniovina]